MLKNVSSPHFFIIGSQRSGTTLLRLLLNSHTDIAIPTEATFLMPLLNRRLLNPAQCLTDSDAVTLRKYLRGNSQFQKWKLDDDALDELIRSRKSLQAVISNLYNAYSSMHHKPIAGDKSPTFIRKLPIITRVFPEAKFIYIVRDGRDTFLSLKAKNAPGSESLALGAIEWSVKQALIERHLSPIRHRVHKIRYEDLLKNTGTVLMEICRFLGIHYELGMLEFWKKSEGFIAKHHSELIFQPIDPSNIFKWKKIFTDKDNAVYSFFAKHYLMKNNYELSCEKLEISAIVKCIGEAGLVYLPKRLFRIIKIAMVMRMAQKSGKSVDNTYYD